MKESISLMGVKKRFSFSNHKPTGISSTRKPLDVGKNNDVRCVEIPLCSLSLSLSKRSMYNTLTSIDAHN